MAKKTITNTTGVRPTAELAEKAVKAGEGWCVPENLDELSEYSLDILNSHEHRNGVYWEAILYKGDRPVLWVDNEGNGGPNSYHPIPGVEYADRSEWRTLLNEFVEATQRAYPGTRYETEDHFCSFLDLIANDLALA